MTVTPAAGLPRLGPGEFRFITKAMEAAPGEDGRRRFKTIASSTVRDLAGDEMKMSALEDMRTAFQRGITIFMNHKYVVPEDVFGRSDSAEIRNSGEVDAKSGFPIYDLHIAGFVDETNPRAIQAADSMAAGMIYGTSVGAIVKAHQKNKSGGMDIIHVDLKEGSMVGVPMNQRSWAQKSATAAAALPVDLDEEEVGDTEEHDVAAAPEDTTKAVMDAEARNDLSDSDFACPEKRKYPINDKAHVRAALSRVADPNNDQCGKAKIIAAARRMGIGEHDSKGLEPEDLTTWSDDDFTTWAMKNACPTCGSDKEHGGDCPDDYHTTKSIEDAEGLVESENQEEASESTSEATDDGQPEGEAEPEAATEEPAETAKAAGADPGDVVELVRKVGVLVEEIAHLREENASLREQVNGELEQRKSAEADLELAKEALSKALTLPLRRKAVGHLAEKSFAERFPQYDPAVADYLSRGDK